MFKQNVQLAARAPMTAWRKISFGSWRPTGDSSIHTELELEVSAVLRYLRQRSIVEGRQLRLMHFVGPALARCVAEQPRINAIVRFGRLYPRRDVDVFFHVADVHSGGEDLSGITIRRADRLDLYQFRSAYQRKLARLRDNREHRFDRVKGIFAILPGALSRMMLDFTGWLSYSLNVFHPALGIPRDGFGSLMITNIGALGIDMAFAPIAPYTRIPMVVAVGRVRKRPIVRNNRCVPAPTVRLCFTLDHRLMEGVHFAKLSRSLKRYFEQPHLLDARPGENDEQYGKAETSTAVDFPDRSSARTKKAGVV